MRRGRTFLAGLSAPRVPSPAVAAAAYAVVTIVLLWPALSGQRVLVAASDLYLWAPWHSSQPEGLHDYLNPLLSDQTRSFYPWLSYARDQLHAGHLPQWNPFALSGTPFLANGQSQLFSVFSLPVWLLPLNYGLAVSAAMRLWDATTAWLEFPYLFELQRPKNAMYGAVIADRLRPYLDARDWVSIDRGRVVPIR